MRKRKTYKQQSKTMLCKERDRITVDLSSEIMQGDSSETNFKVLKEKKPIMPC